LSHKGSASREENQIYLSFHKAQPALGAANVVQAERKTK